jgi:alpha-L-fucosidase
MNFKCYFVLTLLLLIVIPGKAQDNQSEKERNERIEWFREARFGMFIHWGLYSATEGEWKGKTTPALGEWIQNTLKIPEKDYVTLVDKFTLAHYNPDAWAAMAKNAGVRYVVITSKHHDGFSLFPSKVSDFNITLTPYKKDPLKELIDACHRQGLKFGFYYSHRQDWHEEAASYAKKEYNNHFGKPKNQVKADLDKYIKEKAIPQVRELLTNYGPIDLIWFDTPLDLTKEQSQAFVDVVRQIQPKCLINGRVGYNLGDYGPLGDNEIPCCRAQSDLEMVATMNNTWGYKKSDNNWKSPQNILGSLLECASRGVNYMINIGPKADGIVPQPSIDILNFVGNWMHTNSEAIYGTTGNPFNDNFPWGYVTRKGHDLYLLLNQKPIDNKIVLKGVKGKLLSAKLLNDGKLLKTDFGNELYIRVPLLDYTKIPVIKLSFDSMKELTFTPKNFEYEGIIDIPAVTGKAVSVSTDAENEESVQNDFIGMATKGKKGIRFATGGYTENFNGKTGKLMFSCEVDAPGKYEVRLYTNRHHSRSFTEGTQITLTIGKTQFNHILLKQNAEIANTRQHSYPDSWSRVGYVTFNKSGEQTLLLSVDKLGRFSVVGKVGEDLTREVDNSLRLTKIELRKVE